MATAEKTITVKINAELATDYWTAYARAFGIEGSKDEDLAGFIADFIEDRLSEEIEFAEGELEPERE